MLTQKDIQKNWLEFRGGLKNIWANLDETALDHTEGDLLLIADTVFAQTGEDREAITKKLNSLIDSFDNVTDKKSYYTSSYQRSPLGPGQGATSDRGQEYPFINE